jgi:hypothetical protein
VLAKHGLSGFRFSVLQVMNDASLAEIRKAEYDWILKYDSYTHGANASLDTSQGLNGRRAPVMTEELRRKYHDTSPVKKTVYVYNKAGLLVYVFGSSCESDRFFKLRKGRTADKIRLNISLHGKYFFSYRLKIWNPEEEAQARAAERVQRVTKTRIERGSYKCSEKQKQLIRVRNSIRQEVDLFCVSGEIYKHFISLNECDDFLGLTRGTTSKVIHHKNGAKTLRKKYIPKLTC